MKNNCLFCKFLFITFVSVACFLIFRENPNKTKKNEKYEDRAIQILVRRQSDEARIYAFSSRYIEATVTLSVSGNNLKCTPQETVIRGLSLGLNDPIVTIHPADKGNELSFDYSSSWHIGSRIHRIQSRNKYVVLNRLPFLDNKSYKVIQTALGPTHLKNSPQENCVDFEMPVGSLVCASKSGMVIGYREDSELGGNEDLFEYCGNYIIVKHKDGTYAEYHHLKHNGVLVPLGREVAEGQVIALSGNTGKSGGPHLHFGVFQYDADGKAHSLPVKFNTLDGIVIPKEGEYLSNVSVQQ